MLLALSTGHKIGLAGFAAAFVVFALLAALVIPRWRPDFPGERGRNWFILATLALFVAMLFAVEVFAKEEEEGHEAAPTTVETGVEPPPPETETTAPPQGDAEAGKAVFSAQGCGSCHTLAAVGSQATTGPNLDESLEGKDAAYTRESIVEPNAVVAEGYQPNIMPQDYGDKLSEKQLADLVALVTKG